MSKFCRAALAAGFVLVAGPAMAETGSLSQLSGWAGNDHAAAWGVFHQSCETIIKKKSPLGPGTPQDGALRKVCSKATELSENLSGEKAKDFFEANFQAEKLTASQKGLMTGYYEPEFSGSRHRSEKFPVPVLRRPQDLVSNQAPPSHPDLTAARRDAHGKFVPFPDRAGIESGALKNQHLEIFWMGNDFDLFTMQVQGSARLKLDDGTVVRLAYDGKNGQPYTSVGKVLIERGILKKGQVTMQAIGAAFEKNPQLAHEVMRENKSYVFFRESKNADPTRGPLGAQGLALTPLRSIAVDRKIHPYGLPFYISGMLPQREAREFNQLVIAQDTGTAITGTARIDLFTGWGADAAALAGVMQEHIDLYVLRPKD